MHTAIVILNWNTADYLCRFIPGILRSIEGLDAELVVADNGSTDGSMEVMARQFPMVRKIVFDRNYGFTGGYNKALAQIDADYFLLINSDIEVTDGWLQPLIALMDEDRSVGACAPKLHSWYEKDKFEYAGAAGGYLDSYGFPFCRGRLMGMVEEDKGQYDVSADVFWATGACLMIRKSLFDILGGLDDRFFAHMEEIDLCWRVQLAGFKVRIVPESTVYHLGGGTLPQTSPWKLRLNYRNDLMLLENNLAKTYALDILRKRQIRTEDKEALASLLNHTAKTAYRSARWQIFKKMLIDGCCGIIYLAMLKWSYCKAVMDAHKEYRKIGRRGIGHVTAYLYGCFGLDWDKNDSEYVPSWINGSLVKGSGGALPEISGRYPHWIIPKAVILREKAFREVHDMERVNCGRS